MDYFGTTLKRIWMNVNSVHYFSYRIQRTNTVERTVSRKAINYFVPIQNDVGLKPQMPNNHVNRYNSL